MEGERGGNGVGRESERREDLRSPFASSLAPNNARIPHISFFKSQNVKLSIMSSFYCYRLVG